MRGTDVTPEQMKHAEEFVMNSALRGYSGPVVHIGKRDLFRLVAWYGAVRANSGNSAGELGPITAKGEAEA